MKVGDCVEVECCFTPSGSLCHNVGCVTLMTWCCLRCGHYLWVSGARSTHFIENGHPQDGAVVGMSRPLLLGPFLALATTSLQWRHDWMGYLVPNGRPSCCLHCHFCLSTHLVSVAPWLDSSSVWHSQLKKHMIVLGFTSCYFTPSTSSTHAIKSMLSSESDDFGYWERQGKIGTMSMNLPCIMPIIIIIRNLLFHIVKTGIPDVWWMAWGFP